MILSGMMKLRVAITMLFMIIVISLLLSFMAVDTEEKEIDMWYDTLSDVEIEELNELYTNFPYESESDNLYEVSGLLVWLLTGGLFILMIKVWQVEDITSLESKETTKREIIICSNCQKQYLSYHEHCPYCGVESE